MRLKILQTILFAAIFMLSIAITRVPDGEHLISISLIAFYAMLFSVYDTVIKQQVVQKWEMFKTKMCISENQDCFIKHSIIKEFFDSL